MPFDVDRDIEPLFNVMNGSPILKPNASIEKYDPFEKIWKGTAHGPFSNSIDFCNYFQGLSNIPNVRLCCVFDAAYNYQIGFVAIKNNCPEHLKLELGYGILTPIAQGKHFLKEIAYLLVNYVFELGYRRIEFNFLPNNDRMNGRFIKKEYPFEFIQKNYLISRNQGQDWVFCRFLNSEWPPVKEYFENLLYNKVDSYRI